MSTIVGRSKDMVTLDHFRTANHAEKVAQLDLSPPLHQQYVLRCPIGIPEDTVVRIPDEMLWTIPLAAKALEHVVVNHRFGALPYMYLTIRHGLVTSTADDVWHVDGFSTKVPHVPEVNYVWTSVMGTEVLGQGIEFPADFDPRKHNVHQYIQDHEDPKAPIEQLESRVLYAMDPYVIHRRPHVPEKIWRTFVRVSFAPIPIDDKNNHINPAFGDISTDYDGIRDFRDKLDRYVTI